MRRAEATEKIIFFFCVISRGLMLLTLIRSREELLSPKVCYACLIVPGGPSWDPFQNKQKVERNNLKLRNFAWNFNCEGSWY